MKLYHWTSKKNAVLIGKKGLKHGRWCIYLCRKPEFWHGEVCYEINIDASQYCLSELNDWEIMCWDDIQLQYISKIDKK